MSDLETREKILEQIGKTLPPYFKITEQSVYNPRTLYNLCSLGRGPTVVSLRGQKFLERESFLEWLKGDSGKRGRKRLNAA